MKREEAKRFWLIRYENAKDYTDPHWEAQERREHREYVEALRMAIEALAERTGEWIYSTKQLEIVPMWECSCCRIRAAKKFNFCPHCGADMRGEPMNDLISRKALCDYALNQKDKSVTPNDIMRFPSAQPEQRWIPCSERLPEIACRCLVTLSNNIVAVGTLHSEGEYEDDFGYIVNWGKRWHLEPASMMIAYHEDSVIAWMPLPEPYKGGDDE